MESPFGYSGSFLAIITLISFFLGNPPVPVTAAATDPVVNPLVELSSRAELVNIAGYGEEKLSTVTVTGKVLCHACMGGKFPVPTHPVSGTIIIILIIMITDMIILMKGIQNDSVVSLFCFAFALFVGAKVSVFCGSSGKSNKSWARGSSDEYGDFFIDLPSHLHAIPNLEKVCSVRVLQLPKSSLCRPAFTGKHKGLKLVSIGDGARAYTADDILLMPRSLGGSNKRTRQT